MHFENGKKVLLLAIFNLAKAALAERVFGWHYANHRESFQDSLIIEIEDYCNEVFKNDLAYTKMRNKLHECMIHQQKCSEYFDIKAIADKVDQQKEKIQKYRSKMHELLKIALDLTDEASVDSNLSKIEVETIHYYFRKISTEASLAIKQYETKCKELVLISAELQERNIFQEGMLAIRLCSEEAVRVDENAATTSEIVLKKDDKPNETLHMANRDSGVTQTIDKGSADKNKAELDCYVAKKRMESAIKGQTAFDNFFEVRREYMSAKACLAEMTSQLSFANERAKIHVETLDAINDMVFIVIKKKEEMYESAYTALIDFENFQTLFVKYEPTNSYFLNLFKHIKSIEREEIKEEYCLTLLKKEFVLTECKEEKVWIVNLSSKFGEWLHPMKKIFLGLIYTNYSLELLNNVVIKFKKLQEAERNKAVICFKQAIYNIRDSICTFNRLKKDEISIEARYIIKSVPGEIAHALVTVLMLLKDIKSEYMSFQTILDRKKKELSKMLKRYAELVKKIKIENIRNQAIQFRAKNTDEYEGLIRKSIVNPTTPGSKSKLDQRKMELENINCQIESFFDNDIKKVYEIFKIERYFENVKKVIFQPSKSNNFEQVEAITNQLCKNIEIIASKNAKIADELANGDCNIDKTIYISAIRSEIKTLFEMIGTFKNSVQEKDYELRLKLAELEINKSHLELYKTTKIYIARQMVSKITKLGKILNYETKNRKNRNIQRSQECISSLTRQLSNLQQKPGTSQVKNMILDLKFDINCLVMKTYIKDRVNLTNFNFLIVETVEDGNYPENQCQDTYEIINISTDKDFDYERSETLKITERILNGNDQRQDLSGFGLNPIHIVLQKLLRRRLVASHEFSFCDLSIYSTHSDSDKNSVFLQQPGVELADALKKEYSRFIVRIKQEAVNYEILTGLIDKLLEILRDNETKISKSIVTITPEKNAEEMSEQFSIQDTASSAF